MLHLVFERAISLQLGLEMTIATFGFSLLPPFMAKGIRQPRQAVAVGPAPDGSIVRGGSALGV